MSIVWSRRVWRQIGVCKIKGVVSVDIMVLIMSIGKHYAKVIMKRMMRRFLLISGKKHAGLS